MEHVATLTLMTPSEAGRRLRLTPAAVKSHDDELAPVRTLTGRRIYTTTSVERRTSDITGSKAERVLRIA